MKEVDYYNKSLELIDNVLKGKDNGNNYPYEEYTMWYYFLELLGKENYNSLMEDEYFETFHKMFRQTDIEMDLFRAPLVECRTTSISSGDSEFYKERITYRRNIETNESPKIQGLIWNFIHISTVPLYVWSMVKYGKFDF